ncbi:hypothetical protein H6P81_013683 [Aristolochia fimbriata]|uniref:Uncharacterized protein n=1 Tax=Aristolochia fimbriata TaxID=158543 RepID=A0AAV7EFD5_ARIFI|nr:hypothetical protein H6P81_013683 [Aristolochia fimbriata]
MVLGVSWLATLGPVLTDYAARDFEFDYKGARIHWKGEQAHGVQPTRCNSRVCAASMKLMLSPHSFALELSPNEHEQVRDYPTELSNILETFSDVFQKPQGLPPQRAQDHAIHLLPNSRPVNIKPYRYPYFQKQEMERLIIDMLKDGIIQPSTSPFSSPVLLVRKKDGTWRFCVDYRALNVVTVRDRFPIPTIDELFDELHGAQYFSKLDLLAGYHQIRIKAEDVEKTAFRTHNGHYEFLVMPFGLSNAPSTFQAIMNDVFRPYLRRFVLVFFDDILIYSPSWESHLEHVKVVLQLLREHQLVAKQSKCLFGQTQVDYLGHIICQHGLAVDPSKISTIQQWPQPKNVREVRSFLGLAGYYRRFIRHYAQIASPLTDLLRKDAFLWNEDTQQAFETLKERLSSTPVLTLPDFSVEFQVETDASGLGIGAILSQRGHPVAFFSQKLCSRMQKASTYHREMYAITQAKEMEAILAWKFVFVDDLKEANKSHPELLELQQKLQDNPDALPNYSFREGLLFYRGKLIIPSDSPLRLQLLHEYHSSPIGGHAGTARTFHRLSSNFSWKHMRRDVQHYVATCQTCQQMKDSFQRPAGLLQPLSIPGMVFEQISMDFITCLPSSKGKATIMTVVDRLSKYGHFIPLPASFTSRQVAEAFVAEIIRLHGPPSSIITDRDPRFLHSFWQEVNRLQGTSLAQSTDYHPQTDGQTEALNKCVEMYLRCFVSDSPHNWLTMLPWAEYWYNTAFQTIAGLTPLQVLYGRELPTMTRYILGSSSNDMVEKYMLSRDEVLVVLKHNLSQAQGLMKEIADRKRRDLQLAVDDWVYVKLQPYRQASIRLHHHHKLGRRYFGPYRVLKRIGEVAYKLELLEAARIHPVFHVSLLKKCVGSPDQQITPLIITDDISPLDMKPEVVLGQRVILQDGKPVEQVLIRWAGMGSSEATWEDRLSITSRFPDLNIEDKVLFRDGGIVVNQPAMSQSNDNLEADVEKVSKIIRRSTRERQPSRRFEDFLMGPGR